MADYLNNIACGDAYTKAATLGPNFQADNAVITVANNAALMQFAVGRPGNWGWSDEREYESIPQSFRVGRIIGVRLRNANAGQVARVLATLSGPDDVEFEAGTPFTSTLSASGSISAAMIMPSLALAAFPPAAPTEGQTVELILPSTYDPVGGKPVRWLCTYDATAAVWHVKGPPLYAEVQTAESSASTAYTALATPGPSILLPRPGDYFPEVGSDAFETSAGIAAVHSYDIGATAAVDADASFSRGAVAAVNVGGSTIATREKVGLAVVTLTSKYKNSAAGSAQWQRRFMRLWPLRIT